MNDLLARINNEIYDYIHGQGVEIIPGIYFHQYDTIKRIHAYIHNRYYRGGYDEDGRPLMFLNISNDRAEAITRFIDVDTKDIRLTDISGNKRWGVKLLEYELKQYLRDHWVADILNEIVTKLPKWGTVIVAKDYDKLRVVKPYRIIMDQSVDTIKDSNYIIEYFDLDPFELRKKEADGWNNIEQAIKMAEENAGVESDHLEGTGAKRTEVRIYRRYGYVDGSEFGKKGEVFACCIVAEPKITTRDNGDTEYSGVVLFKEEWDRDNIPYDDIHFIKIDGRYWGLGVTELLFPIQERVNELVNQQRAIMELSSLQLFQTTSLGGVYNVKDLRNGDILAINVNGQIQQIPIRDTNIGSYQRELLNYLEHARRLTHANEIISGSVPSSMPATNAVLSNNNQTRIHLFRRENLAIFLRRIFTNWVLDDIIKNLNKEHIVVYMGEDLPELIDRIRTIKVAEWAKEQVLKGEPITQADIDEQLQKDYKDEPIEVLKGYYKSIKFDLDFNIDGEQQDMGKLATNTFTFIKNISQAPGVLDDPVLGRLLREYADAIGIDIDKLKTPQKARVSGNPAEAETQDIANVL